MNPFINGDYGNEIIRCSQISEPQILELIRQRLGDASPSSPQGIGDDCAVYDPPLGESLLLTTDPVVHGVHFDNSHPPAAVGAKLLKRNLSDIAAMGGKPGPALLALAMGPDLRLDWLGEFIDGLAKACAQYEVPLAGGDITSAKQSTFTATLTQTGYALHPVTRKGALADASIWVTGQLGGSLPSNKHLDFKPRLEEGQWLAAQDSVLSMTDLSDGIAKDVLGLLPKGTQAHLELSSIPVAEDADNLYSALTDGEDYELLFTLAPNNCLEEWPFSAPVTQIGIIAEGSPESILVNQADGKPLDTHRGYEHFS